jgi:NAD(P)-dependent dehydrogenase (short-subunit alcohol dehydrogenase family)
MELATSEGSRILETAGAGLRVTSIQPGNTSTDLLGMSTDTEAVKLDEELTGRVHTQTREDLTSGVGGDRDDMAAATRELARDEHPARQHFHRFAGHVDGYRSRQEIRRAIRSEDRLNRLVARLNKNLIHRDMFRLSQGVNDGISNI